MSVFTRALVFASCAAAIPLFAAQTALQVLRSSTQAKDFRVIASWSDVAKAKPPSIPTLAPMKGFPLSTQKRPWRVSDFFRARSYDDAVLLAVLGKRKSNVSIANDLPRLWRRAPPSQRVFVAFARQDLRAANALRAALERAGYQSFIYLPGKKNPRWADPAHLGRYFREAGQRLVLDSRAARSATGVRLESHAARRRKGEACCKICYSLNGMLAGCEPATCGAQCANARGAAPRAK
jgi:hypothetical protein